VILRRIIGRIRLLLGNFLLNRFYKRRFWGYWSDLPKNSRSKTTIEHEIMVLCHTIEKALSHMNLRPLFAEKKIIMINKLVRSYVEKFDVDEYIVNLACSTINLWSETNRALGVATDRLIFIDDIKYDNINVGIDVMDKENYFKSSDLPFGQLTNARHSVRLYDSKSLKITLDRLLKIVSVASLCPSACNRQATRVKIILNKDKIKHICEVQQGSRGFGENCGALLLITSDIRYYMLSEQRVPMLDAGIFVQNLLYSLYAEKLGSCVLNASFTVAQENALCKYVKLPDYEMLAAIIAVSDISEGLMFKVARSTKKEVQSIIDVIE
jgi:nitroreductase